MLLFSLRWTQALFIIMTILCLQITAQAQTSVFRLKTGVSSLKVTSGDLLNQSELKSMINLTPSILWDFPSFSSRFGLQYLMELNSPYGLTPMSGIGFAAYYHIFGITSGFEYTKDEVLIQKSKPGPYIYAAITPVNVNLNKFDTEDSGGNFYLSAMVNDISLGLGYDYPILENMTMSGEFAIRNGRSIEATNNAIEYSGWTMSISVASSYF